MEAQNLVTKLTQVLPRKDGSECRIVVTKMYGLGLVPSVDVYVHRRESPGHDWKLCDDKPHKDWLTMDRDDYVKYGRSEKLEMVSHGEILKLISLIGQPLSVVNETYGSSMAVS